MGGYFEEKDVNKLLQRYAQAVFISQECDHLCEYYYAWSSGLGSLAGAAAIVALAFQAMSFSDTAPAWCRIVGSMGSVFLFGVSIVEGAHGYDDCSKLLHTGRTEFGAVAHEIYQALCFQPHFRWVRKASKLDKKARDVVDQWDADKEFSKVLDIGVKCHREADGVRKILKQ